MATPLITVVVTTYNYGRFIEEAIDSVISQDFPQEKVQIVVVDDGSTDDAAERVKKYGSRIQYFYKPNGGQASALNLGIAKAKGEIITFLDADDFFTPNKLARVVGAFQREISLGMAYHRIQEWHMRNGERRDWDFVAVSGDLRKEPEKFMAYLTPPNLSVSYRRSVLDSLLPIPEQIRMVADCYLAALIPFIAPVQAIPEILAIYRIHGENSHYMIGGQASREARERKLQMWRTVNEATRRWLAVNGYSKKQPIVRFFLDRWALHEENQEFALEPPGRLRFFLHLLRYIRCHKREMGWRLRIINFVNTVGALFTGYRYFSVLEQWPLRLSQLLRKREPQMRGPKC